MKKENILHLSLKKQWFDMIKSGEKKEEYRDITPFWSKRLCVYNKEDNVYDIANFDAVEFTLGYPKADEKDKRIKFEVTNITIDFGKPEWGAKPQMRYFVIHLGNEIKEGVN